MNETLTLPAYLYFKGTLTAIGDCDWSGPMGGIPH